MMKPTSKIVLKRQETEVVAKPKRRTFTAEYKLRILREADSCQLPGQIGALLRREGLYSSHLVDWRNARLRGELGALSPKKRGKQQVSLDHRDLRIAELERQNQTLLARAQRAEALVEIQKKVSELLGLSMTELHGRSL